jgi:hypothetical protein
VGYYANFGPLKGTLKASVMHGAIDVLPACDNEMPIGRANPIGPDADGNALFALVVHGRAVEGP